MRPSARLGDRMLCLDRGIVTPRPHFQLRCLRRRAQVMVLMLFASLCLLALPARAGASRTQTTIMEDDPPHATIDTFRTTCQHVLEEGEQQEQLIDALLALAQGQRGLDRRELLDLGVIARRVLERATRLATERGIELDVSLDPALMLGDAPLVERLLSNLIDNAIRHNVVDGRVRVQVSTRLGSATVRVVNTGMVVPAVEIDRLLQPFQRLSPDRVSHHEGLGLGLSIVAAIAAAHDAPLDVHPATEGGLDIEVHFPPVQGAVLATTGPPENAEPAITTQQNLY